ncbi:MAG TPA: LptA/OstA family protein [Acidobacteriaceae bacterium]|nr:LptA/OstA family protein [Acidobacteriaceae bacterium]
MRLTIKGLRQWIIGAAALLLVVVAGFLFYGRYRFRHIARDLPARLGINIQQTATGFSYSQSSQGHTLFTLKASKEFQLRSGHVLLHNVDITLYGPPGSNRTDHIYGSDFDYDQNAGVAISHGEVQIELAGMSGEAPAAGSAGAKPGAANTIRVQTSGVTFAQKTGEASTAQPVEFQLPRASGTSVGADYNSKSGVLILNSQVHIATSNNGKTALIGAAHATLLRASQEAFLTTATIAYERETGSADQATVWFRKDGTAEKIDAEGHVRMATQTGATAASQTAEIVMDAKSQPVQAVMGGGVEFASARGNDTMNGSSREATLDFVSYRMASGSTQTQIRHAEFRQAVEFAELGTGLEGDPCGREEKHLAAQKVDVEFARTAPGQPVEARLATAEGNPVVTMQQLPTRRPSQTTRISGDRLVATLAGDNELERLDGTGNTQIAQNSSDGAHDSSRGALLRATFVQQAPARRGAAPQGEAQSGGERPCAAPATAPHPAGAAKPGSSGPKTETALETAVQDGNVVLTETPARKPGSSTQPATLTGWAQHAEYHAGDQVLHLSGKPRISDGATMQLSAEQIDYHRDSQDAAAEGDVKATYIEPPKQAGGEAGPEGAPAMGGNGPVHIIAERAEMHHATNTSFFYGRAEERARMWQDTDSLLAPVIEVDRNQNVLKAWSEMPSSTGQEPAATRPLVNANFTSAMGAKHQATLVRVNSETLVYSDKTREGDFRGEVTAEESGETIQARDALVFLKPAGTATRNAAHPEKENSQIDHVVATGQVVITEPGRRGEGEKLVYTADNGVYVLTGTAEKLPALWDRAHGTTTGAELTFNSQNDRIQVNGGKSSAVTHTVAPK